MHVVDMIEGHKTMQRRVDGGRTRVEIERAMGKKTDHAVFVFHTAIDALERFKLFHVEGREAVKLDGADIAARSLDPHDADLVAGERVGFPDFGRGIATTVIGDPFVSAQKVGAIEKLSRLIQRCCISVVPTIFEKTGLSHRSILPRQLLRVPGELASH